MAVLELEPEQLGKLVALEGDSDTIDTQLRLLPPSQKILILPALLDTFPQCSDKDTFNARTFVRDVHSAFKERCDTARAFLRSSTAGQPRLVLQNGGSVSARAACITRIANLTNGDAGQAETIFNEIVKEGIAGLMKEDVDDRDDRVEVTEDNEGAKSPEMVEDPRVRAMKAADSLDRETEALQLDSNSAQAIAPSPEGNVDGLEVGTSQSSVSESVPEKHSSSPKTLPERALVTSEEGDKIVRTVLTIPRRSSSRRFTLEKKRSTFGALYSMSTPVTASTTGQVQSSEEINEDDNEDADLASPNDEALFSVPSTPAVYQEAYLVDVQSASPTKKVKRAQSVDNMFYPSASRLLNPPLPKLLKHTTSDYHLRIPNRGGRFNDDYQTLPRTTFVKASQTTIRKLPTACTSIRSNGSSVQGAPPRMYVDGGENVLEPTPPSEEEPFVPVFPVVEDLVIHLVGDTPNQVLESVISSYKDGSYPAMPKPDTSSFRLSEEGPLGSTVASLEQQKEVPRPESCLTAETDDPGYERRHDYDPYNASYPPDVKRQWPPMEQSRRVDSLDSSVEPPTPTLTPPIVSELNEIAEKFVDFTPTNSKNAINVQNSLRQLLSLHFPAGENGFSQYYYPVALEADRLWKPVFRNDQNTSIGNDGRNLDQIIALGCEDGVKKDFYIQISGQVERLGSKRDGVNKSGKLDIRYLISNAMQHYSGFSTQSSFNPLSNPQVLAALLVPQIESYLAINTSTRLLILQYPASHLSTVLALRKLLGSDILRIAGILDSLASDPPSSKRPDSRHSSIQHTRTESTRTNSITKLKVQTSMAGSVRSSLANKSSTSASFAKADFLLPSTATDGEISTFLSCIWKCLIEKSTFYTPEPEPKPIIVERPPMPPPPTPTGSSRDSKRERLDRERERFRERDIDRDADSNHRSPYRQGGSQSKISRLTGGTATGPSKPHSNYSPSIISTSTARPSTRQRDTEYEPSITSRHTNKYAASIASNKTTASEKERRTDKEWENFYIGEEDSEDDAYDRMIMGRAGQRIVPESEIKVKTTKRDKRKALKWLGLA